MIRSAINEREKKTFKFIFNYLINYQGSAKEEYKDILREENEDSAFTRTNEQKIMLINTRVVKLLGSQV